MRILESIRESFAGLGKWLVNYANIRSDNRIERMDKKAVLTEAQAKFWTRLLQEFQQFLASRMAHRRLTFEAKAKDRAEAYALKQLARSQRYTNKKWAKAKMWGDILKHYRRTRSKMELYRRLRLRRKAILQRAKAKKWQAIGYTVNRFFAALRYQLRVTIRWFRRIHIANPGLLRRLANRATRKFSFLLAFIWLALMGIAIINDFRTFGIFVFLVGPLAFSAFRCFWNGRRRFFPRFGVAMFVPLMVLWVLFQFAKPAKPAIFKPPATQQQPSLPVQKPNDFEKEKL